MYFSNIVKIIHINGTKNNYTIHKNVYIGEERANYDRKCCLYPFSTKGRPYEKINFFLKRQDEKKPSNRS